MKKNIFVFSIFVLSLLIWSPKVSLANIGEPEEYFNGSGTENNPFQIEDCGQLQNIRYFPDNGYHFILNNNIDCSDTVNWNDGAGFMPIGMTYDYDTFTQYGDIFVGNFNGNNKTISDLYINRPTYDYVGLFGYIGSQEEDVIIKDIGLLNINITGNDLTGGLVGYNAGHIENSYTTGIVEGDNSVGGLVGFTSPNMLRTILNSHSSCDVTGVSEVGGLVGYNLGDEITNSYATGDVTGESNIGGLVGENTGGGNIESSYATGDVECGFGFELEGSIRSCGGLVGLNEGSHIENTYATGDVSGFTAGGLVGQSLDKTIVNSYATGDVSGFTAGGLVGQSLDKTIVNSYATGNITGTVAGGLIGYLYGDFVYNSYSTGNITGVYNETVEGEFGEGSIIGGLIGLLICNEGESVDDYVSNSGWYKSRNNSDLSGVGMAVSNGDGGPVEVTYTETNSSAFYSRNHGIYENAIEYEWNFNGNPWYEQGNNYPKFIEQEGGRRSGRSSGGSGSSPAIIASFQAEQLARALAVGADTTPYLNGPTSPEASQDNVLNILRTLKQSMTGDDVKVLQKYLNTHGYDCGLVDGVFGLKTKQAVIKFQIANGLISDGIVGPMTRALFK